MRILLATLAILMTIGLTHSVRDGNHRSCGEHNVLDMIRAYASTWDCCIVSLHDLTRLGT